MTRIRYNKKNHYLDSKEQILCNNVFVYTQINLLTLEYSIYTKDGQDLAKGQGRNLADCKKKVKSALKLLGANFHQEIRNRGKTQKL